jgi:hypothetical protein
MRILNFTQHQATAEQVADGVVEPEPADKVAIQRAITFQQLPSSSDLRRRAKLCALLARELKYKYRCAAVLIGGAPYFMSHLENALRSYRVRFCYAFSRREVEEQIQPDGSVRKTHVFKHVGFIFDEEDCE